MSTPSDRAAAVTPPLFIADDLALDFVNSAFGVGAERRECLNSDAQVLEWLRRSGLPAEPAGQLTKARAGTLLSAALALRETARELVQKRKAGSVGDPAELNRVLALSSGYQQLNWKKGQAPKFEHHDRQKAAEALLVPVAQAVARLLSQGDFTLIRECEHPSCTLWFYDRTKSHQRRWCRMTACGNRAKVAAFRARRRK